MVRLKGIQRRAFPVMVLLAIFALSSGRLFLLNREIGHMIALNYPELILDAGHGGEDGGAVSLSGVPESRINLAIVLDMEDILGLYGVCPLLLRREDCSLHDESAENLRQKKVSDLKNRVSIVEHTKNADFISIHQNSYPDSRQQGLQVFYAPTKNSDNLAE